MIIDIITKTDILLGKSISVDFLLTIDRIENKINKSIIAIIIWIEIVLADRLLSTTILPSHAWNKIATRDKNARNVIKNLLLIYFKELINKIKTEIPAIAPISLFMYSIHVW